jgi:cytochrome c
MRSVRIFDGLGAEIMKAVILAGVVVVAGLTGTAAVADCPTPAGLTPCKTCHVLEPGKPSRGTGPNIVGIPGQKALHAADFKGYSEAMKAASAKGLTWTDDNLMAYIADPKGFLASFNGQALKNAMTYQQKDEAKRKAAVEGLKTIAACQ